MTKLEQAEAARQAWAIQAAEESARADAAEARAEKAELELARAIPIWEEALTLARERAERAEAALAELNKLYREQSGRPSQELLNATIKELTERAEKAEREWDEWREKYLRIEEERDEIKEVRLFWEAEAYKQSVEIAKLKAMLQQVRNEIDKLQADLDAALDVVDNQCETEPTGRVLALLKKRREQRG